jgi:hypothetical protein
MTTHRALIASVVICALTLAACFQRTDCIVENRTGGEVTDIELIGHANVVHIDRLAPNESRRVDPPAGEGFSVKFTDDGGRWIARGAVYIDSPGSHDVLIGPGRTVAGQTAERVR